MATLNTKQLLGDVDALKDVLSAISTKIHGHPELKFEERRAAAWLVEAVEEAGIPVETSIGELPTAFRARIGTGSGPRVAILAEYDALPEIGHACGHNLIAGGALGAFLALAGQASAVAGTVDLVGTPAEEGGGGKIKLLEAGVFEGVTAAMMFHPFDRDLTAHTALANVWVRLAFHGKPSHAALAPWDGQSALTACLDTFKLIDSQRVHFRDGVRVHGWVTNGGQAANIIPEFASAEFSVRARNRTELERVRGIVERCARGAALASGVAVDVVAREGYRDMRNNLTLARRFGDHLVTLGRTPSLTDETAGSASTDMGDVSHVVPAIHPWLAICDKGEAVIHQRAFAVCAASERALATMLDAAKAMALTTADLLADASLRDAVRTEFATG